ncbi:MAG: glycosyltransferase family 39 protein [Armatimonadetes bacterium]|nr:glycosyltransferase family 39 protein [Armatimonadota bacterium]
MTLNYLLFGIIFILGLFLRFYGLNTFTDYLSSDHVQQVLASLNYFNYKTLFTFNIKQNLIAGVFSYAYGFVTITFIYTWILFLKFLHLPINETNISYLSALTGSLSVLGIYLLIKELVDSKSALLCSFLAAIEPYLIVQSKDLGRYHIISALSLFIFTLYFFILYFKTKNSLNGWLASIFLAVYIGSSNMFMGILPLIFYIAYLYCGKKDIFKLFFKKEILILPGITFLLYLSALIYVKLNHLSFGSAFLGKPLDKPKILGFYLSSLSTDYISNVGYIIYSLFYIGLIYGVFSFLKNKKESLIFIWALIYTIPFLFFTPPSATVVRVYIMESQTSWAILGILGLYYLYKNSNYKILKYFLSSLIFSLFLSIILLTSGFALNFPIYSNFSLGAVKDLGSLPYAHTGAKAAGFYARENIPEGENIFTDLEPMLAQFYFGRNKIFCQYDAHKAENLKYFKIIKDKIKWVIIDFEDENIYPLRDFYKAAEIHFKNKPLRVIYAKGKKEILKIDAEIYNLYFRRKYEKLNKFIPNKLEYPSEGRILD